MKGHARARWSGFGQNFVFLAQVRPDFLGQNFGVEQVAHANACGAVDFILVGRADAAQGGSNGGISDFFLVGLFSVLDALMDCPMAELLQSLPLAEDIIQALLYHEGVLGTMLHCGVAYERGEWEEVTRLGIDDQLVIGAYLKAISWADEIYGMLWG